MQTSHILDPNITTGIAEQIAAGIAQDKSASKREASKQIYLIDKQGLLLDNDESLTVAQKPFAQPASEWSSPSQERKSDTDTDTKDLKSLIRRIKPHVLIGTSTVPNAFTESAIREMAKHTAHPIIFPLSNPTRLHEAQPSDLLEWTDGKALVATGSPFPAVTYNDKEYEIAECNNSVCFPGIGLGCVLGRVKLLTDGMLVAAVHALAGEAPAVKEGDMTRGLCPGVERVREVSVKIAGAVLRAARREGVLGVEGTPGLDGDEKDGGEDELEAWIRSQMWEAEYREFVAP